MGSHADGKHDEPGGASEFKTSQALGAKGRRVARCVYSMTLFDLEDVAFCSLPFTNPRLEGEPGVLVS